MSSRLPAALAARSLSPSKGTARLYSWSRSGSPSAAGYCGSTGFTYRRRPPPAGAEAMAAPAGFAGLVLYEPPVAVSEPLGGESLQGRAAAALQDGDRDRALTIFFRDIVQVPRPFTAATRLVRPTWRKLRECIPAQVADTEAIDSLGVGVDRYVCRRSSARV